MPNPNKIARVDLNSVLFWTAQVYDRAFFPLDREDCAVINRAYNMTSVPGICVDSGECYKARPQMPINSQGSESGVAVGRVRFAAESPPHVSERATVSVLWSAMIGS